MRHMWALALAIVVGACSVAPAVAAAEESTSGGISAQYSVPLSVSPCMAFDESSGASFLDGVIENPMGSGTNVTAVVLIVEYHSTAHVILRTDAWGIPCWVLSPGSRTTFHAPFYIPAGYDHYHASATGQSTNAPRVVLTVGSVSSGLGDYGTRWRLIRVTNSSGQTVVGPWASVYETKDTAFWDVMWPRDAFAQRLANGESVDYYVWGVRPLWGSDTFEVVWWAEASPAPPTSPVYRFYNMRTGTHFYTIDPNERNSVIATLGWLYKYEGPAYQAYPGDYVAETPLYRFYNKQSGTHFYTADWKERDFVITNLPWLYKYEGIGYYVCDSGGLATSAAYRFYNKKTGTHFYTVDPVERDNVIAKLGWLYTYEGPAFNVPKPSGGSI